MEKSFAACPICNRDMMEKGAYTFVCELDVSTLYMMRDQTFRGRCAVVLNSHEDELYNVEEALRNRFFNDVMWAARGLEAACAADKINYAAFGDKVSHVHIHLVPKYRDGPEWGRMFYAARSPRELDPAEKVKLIESIRASVGQAAV